MTCWQAAADTVIGLDGGVELGVDGELDGGDEVACGDALALTTGPAEPVGLAVLFEEVLELLQAARTSALPMMGAAIDTAAFHRHVSAGDCCMVMLQWFPRLPTPASPGTGDLRARRDAAGRA